MQRTAKVLTLVVVAIVLCAGEAKSEIVTIRIEGEVSYVDEYSPLLNDLFVVGDPVSGTYTYQASSAPPNTRSGSSDYWFHSDEYGIKLNIGDFTVQTDPDNVEFVIGMLNDSRGRDGYYLGSYNNLPLSTGLAVAHIGWQLDDYSSTALSGTSLLGTAPILADWSDHWGLNVLFGDKGGLVLETRIESATVMPEPATLLLLGVGALAYLRSNRQ